MTDAASVQATVKDFILAEFLPGEDPDALTADMDLYANQILDSLATLKLVTFLETTFAISIAAHEADAENLGSLETIGNFVVSKA